jgi:hypothetical protein
VRTEIRIIRSAVSRSTPRRARPKLLRRALLTAARWRRLHRRWSRRLIMFTGWTWVAALSFVGVESFEIILGTAALAPELVPIVILVLAGAYFFRERIRRHRSRLRARMRLARSRRNEARRAIRLTDPPDLTCRGGVPYRKDKALAAADRCSLPCSYGHVPCQSDLFR